MFARAFLKFNTSLKYLENKSNRYSYPWKKPSTEKVHKYILLFSNKSPALLKWMSAVSLIQFIGGTLMSSAILNVDAGESTEVSNTMKYVFTGGIFALGVGIMLGTHSYSRHCVLEMGLINPNTMRLVTANFGVFREIHLDAKSIKTGSIDIIKNPQKKQDYFYLELENSKFNYICDLRSKHSYMDRHMTVQFFENKPMYPVESKKKGFPYK
jgi:hypothetical protein